MSLVSKDEIITGYLNWLANKLPNWMYNSAIEGFPGIISYHNIKLLLLNK